MFSFNFCFWFINLCSCTYYKFCRNKKLLNHWIKRYKTVIKKKKKKHDKIVLSGEDNTAKKTKFFFSKCSEKMVFPIKLHWNMIQVVLSGKMILLFPENMILFFRRKKKDDLSQKKIHGNMFSSNVLKRVFPRKSRWNMIFFVISGKMVYLFSRKYIFFL